jgi:CRP-like cAMP-binding protein
VAVQADLKKFMRAVPLFAGLLPSEVERIALVMSPRQIAEGEVVCAAGEPGHEFFLVSDGELAVERNGNTVAKLQTGDHFGELALLDRGPRSATVRALTESQLYVLNEQSFAALLNELPALAQKLLSALASRVRAADRRLEDLDDLT